MNEVATDEGYHNPLDVLLVGGQEMVEVPRFKLWRLKELEGRVLSLEALLDEIQQVVSEGEDIKLIRGKLAECREEVRALKADRDADISGHNERHVRAALESLEKDHDIVDASARLRKVLDMTPRFRNRSAVSIPLPSRLVNGDRSESL